MPSNSYLQEQRYAAQEAPAVAADIRSRIHSGEFKPGQVLTYPELTFINSNYNVLAAAIKILRDEDLLETRKHIGTRVKVPGKEWTTTKDGSAHAMHIEKIMRQRIKDDYSPGLKIPTLQAIGEEFGVSMTTAKIAMQPLKNEGIIYSTPQGTFVSRRPDAPGSPEREELPSR